MSARGADRKDRISIQLFETGRQFIQHLRMTIRHPESTVGLGEDLEFEDPALSTGHVLGTATRTCDDNWHRFLNDSLNYVFTQFRDFVRLCSRLNLANIKTLIYKESAVTRIEVLDAGQITLFLTRAQFIRLKRRASPFWTGAFNSSQSRAFINIRKYSRHRFVFMDWVRGIAIPEFPFPDMRWSNISAIVTLIRKEYELLPCDYCGVVKISGAFMRCCEGFVEGIAKHLPEPMPMNIKRAIEESPANENPNFP
jgi:hypothetical protein